MCARRFLILGFITITEIASSQISSTTHHHLRSPFLRYPTLARSPLRENPRPFQFYVPSKDNFKIHEVKQHPRDRRKKINFWLNRDKLKKSKYIEKFRDSKRPQNDLPLNLPSSYLEPPKFNNDHYNYYSTKENSSIDNGDNENLKKTIGSLKNHRLHVDEKNVNNDVSNYVRDHAPELNLEASEDEETTDSEESSHESAIGTSETPKDRIEFHIHGHEGPETYIFGFDTGDGNNRQFRLEERHEDGSVTGQYGYIDARGKLRKVRYRASPTEGYMEKHHETKFREEI